MTKTKKFRKDFTPEQYEAYLASMAKTEKFEHDGVESWNVKEGEPWDKVYKSKKKMR